MAENRMSSINMAEMEAYKKTFYKDLVEAVNGLAKGGVKYKDVIRYMYAKHGLERNKYMQDEKIEKLYQAFSDKYGEPPIRRPNDFTSGIDRNDYASDEEYYKACKAFAYPINYNGKRNYVFCRAMQDNNKNRLYVHEVFVADKLQNEGNTLQTAASQPHGGIALYKAILSNALSAANIENNSELYNLSKRSTPSIY